MAAVPAPAAGPARPRAERSRCAQPAGRPAGRRGRLVPVRRAAARGRLPTGGAGPGAATTAVGPTAVGDRGRRVGSADRRPGCRRGLPLGRRTAPARTSVTTAEGVLARAKIDRLRAANPTAVDLAVLCALAVRVEPELLRRLRLLLPGADVTAESDLWASDLLAGASTRGIALDPRVADELRADLQMPRWDPLRWAARQLILGSHRELHWSLRLEEQINWHVVAGHPAEQTERLLLAAVGELINTARAAETAGAEPTGAAQVGIARWLLGALARLPRTVAASDAASAAGLAAG